MKILIAGCNGFIGRHCYANFAGEHDVTGCDILENNAGIRNYYQVKNNSDFSTILSENKFDLFINASGSAGVGFSLQYPERDYQLNVANVKEMLEAIRLHQPLCRFINMSSAAVYGNPVSLPINEDALQLPMSVYGKHKVEAEQLLNHYHAEFGIGTTSLRIFSAYGPGLYKQIFWDVFQKSRTARVIRMFGTGNESRDFVFIKDVVRAVNTVAQNGRFNGDRVNVASGTETTIREAVEVFLGKLDGRFHPEFSGEEKEGDPKNWRADISRLQEMGYKPAVDLDQGLRQTALDYKARV